MKDNLSHFLRQLGRRRFIFVPNPGNAGDAFLAHATYQMFGRLGLSYEIGKTSEQYPGQTIVCGGGGNLIPAYADIATFIKRNKDVWHEFILLPHTVRGHPELLRSLDSNCYIFCREEPSLAFVKSHAIRANVLSANDMAFHWHPEETIRSASELWRRRPADAVRRYCGDIRLWWQDRSSRAIRNTKSLNAFRTDVEKTTLPLPSDNVDISRMYAVPDLTPSNTLWVTYRMMKLIRKFDAINTNRLHIGIMSALMGKEVNLYDNNYGKNRDVFRYSLHTFSKVNWCESASNIEDSAPATETETVTATERSLASAHNGITL